MWRVRSERQYTQHRLHWFAGIHFRSPSLICFSPYKPPTATKISANIRRPRPNSAPRLNWFRDSRESREPRQTRDPGIPPVVVVHDMRLSGTCNFPAQNSPTIQHTHIPKKMHIARAHASHRNEGARIKHTPVVHAYGCLYRCARARARVHHEIGFACRAAAAPSGIHNFRERRPTDRPTEEASNDGGGAGSSFGTGINLPKLCPILYARIHASVIFFALCDVPTWLDLPVRG